MFSSKFESKIFSKLEPFGVVRCEKFSTEPTFHVKGESFTAKPDGFDALANIYIETKSSELNSKTKPSTAANAIESQYNWRGGSGISDYAGQSAWLYNNGFVNDCLKYGWNHSIYKHAAVRSQLPDDTFYVIVFDKPPTLKQAERLSKKCLNYCTAESYPTFQLVCLMRQSGMAASFICPSN